MALTFTMAIELESKGSPVNAALPGFTRTNLNGFPEMSAAAESAREIMRVTLLGQDGQTGRFMRCEGAPIPW